MAMRYFPWKIVDVERSDAEKISKHFANEHTDFVQVGPKGYFFPHTYKEQAVDIYNLPLRSNDVFVASYPRSGSTWIRELVWMVANDLNYEESDAVPLVKRFAFLEFSTLVHPKMKTKLLSENADDATKIKTLELLTQPGPQRVTGLSDLTPRFIYTHMPISLLPPTLLETAKVVYIARDPRDVVVSFYHMNRLHRALGFIGDFRTYWNLFINSLIYWTPYFDNLKEAWEKRHHPNMLFLFYEDLVKDLPTSVSQVASFFNKQLNDEQVSRLCRHLSIDSFRSNRSVNYSLMQDLGILVTGEQPYIRKGKSGNWRDYFDEQMTEQAERWISDNLRDTDLRFSTVEVASG